MPSRAWRRNLETSPPNSERTSAPPQEKVEAGYTVNVQRAWNMEAKNKYPYTNYLGDISVREAIQNSLDATIEALQKGEIKEGVISIDVDKDANKFGIEDNGIGMSDLDIRDKFLALHGTGKDVQGRFGGFGIAKAVILAPTDLSTWSLHTRDNFFSHELAQNRQRIQRSINPRQGTKLTVNTNKSYTFSDEAELYARTTEVPKNIKVMFNGAPVDDSLKTAKRKMYHEDLSGGHLLSDGTPLETKLDIAYIPGNELSKRGLNDLNKKQIIRLVDEKTGSKLTQGIRKVHADGFEGVLIIDVKTNSTPGKEYYPLTDSRSELRYDGQEKTDEIIHKYSKEKLSAQRELVEFSSHPLTTRPEWRSTIQKSKADPEFKELQSVIDKISKDLGLTSTQPLDAMNIKIDKGFTGYRGGSPFQGKIALAFQTVAKIMHKKMGYDLGDFYLMLSKKVAGGYTRAEFTGSMDALGLNIVGIDKTALKSPNNLAQWMRDLVGHEITHKYVAKHGQEFDSMMDHILQDNYDNYKYFLDLTEAVFGKEDAAIRRSQLTKPVVVTIPDGRKVVTSSGVLRKVGKEQLGLDFELEESRGRNEIYEPTEGTTGEGGD